MLALRAKTPIPGSRPLAGKPGHPEFIARTASLRPAQGESVKQLLLLIKKETERCALDARHSLTFAWTLLDSGGCPRPQVTPSSAHAERPCITLRTGQYSSLGLVSSQVSLGRKSRCSHSRSLVPWNHCSHRSLVPWSWICTIYCLLFVCLLRRGFSVWPWLFWNSL